MTRDELQLLHSYLNGSLSEAEMPILEALLRESAEARQTFRAFATIEIKCTELASAQSEAMDWMPAMPHFKEATPEPPFSRFRNLTHAVLATAAAIVLACSIWTFNRPQVEINQSVGAELTAILPHGELIGQSAELKAGILELHFRKSDALVAIEAPAKFRIIDAMTLRLESGRVAAHVKDGNQGLRILTPETEVLDLGTRFAVDVRDGKKSEVHVFEGKVAIGGDRKEPLIANQAIKLKDSGDRREGVQLRRASFVQPEEVKPLADALAAGRVEQWQANRAELEKDPSLLVWQDFTQVNDTDSLPRGIQKIHGANIVQGRFPGQRALDFVTPGDNAKLDISGHTKQLTLMSWVRVDRKAMGRTYLLKTRDAKGTGSIAWVIYNGRVAFNLFGLPPAEMPNEIRWPRSKITVVDDLGSWRHLAVTYDADLRKIAFYIDGQLDSEVTTTAGLEAFVSTPYVGNPPLETDSDYVPPAFDINRPIQPGARMDEIVILKRVLDSTEIQRHYASGNPYQ